jgi:hypothetical protein
MSDGFAASAAYLQDPRSLAGSAAAALGVLLAFRVAFSRYRTAIQPGDPQSRDPVEADWYRPNSLSLLSYLLQPLSVAATFASLLFLVVPAFGHNMSTVSPFAGEFTWVSNGQRLCDSVTVESPAAGQLTFCSSRRPILQRGEGTIRLEGTQSWFGVKISAISPWTDEE